MPDKPFQSLYPDYNVLDKWDSPSWNDQTRGVVRKRLTEVPERKFLTETQWSTLEAVADRVMPQPERSPQAKVPITPWVDAKLAANQTSGTRYHPLPAQSECWRRGLDAMEAEARYRFHRSFAKLDPAEQNMILEGMNRGEVMSPAWAPRLRPRLFLRHVLLREIVEIYYAHPDAWSEIGFGGPASPRGYLRLADNRHDSWEGDERMNDALAEVLGK